MFEQRPAACDSEQEARLELRGPSLNPDRQTLRKRQAGPRMPWKENSTEGWGPGAAGESGGRGLLMGPGGGGGQTPSRKSSQSRSADAFFKGSPSQDMETGAAALWEEWAKQCCSHTFRKTNSLRRTMQTMECSLLHQRAQRRASS